jgi:hypothetical protein
LLDGVECLLDGVGAAAASHAHELLAKRHAHVLESAAPTSALAQRWFDSLGAAARGDQRG